MGKVVSSAAPLSGVDVELREMLEIAEERPGQQFFNAPLDEAFAL
jgi:hypothetical protein